MTNWSLDMVSCVFSHERWNVGFKQYSMFIYIYANIINVPGSDSKL